jgi:hypothetical protein
MRWVKHLYRVTTPAQKTPPGCPGEVLVALLLLSGGRAKQRQR